MPRKPPSAPLADRGLAKLRESTALEEDDCQHRFAGCPVLMNDKIVAVVHKDAPEVDVYSRQASGVKLCATLAARSAMAAPKLRSHGGCHSREQPQRGGDRGRVPLCRTSSRGGSPTNSAAGAAFVKTTAGEGVERLRVKAPCRFAVLPDFFGDDILVDAAAIPVAPGGASQRELPAAHDPRRKRDRDDGVGVARERRRRHALGPRRRGKSWPRTSPTGRSRTSGSRCWRTGGSGTSTRLPWPTRTRRSAWSGRCRFPPCGAWTGAPPTR